MIPQHSPWPAPLGTLTLGAEAGCRLTGPPHGPHTSQWSPPHSQWEGMSLTDSPAPASSSQGWVWPQLVVQGSHYRKLSPWDSGCWVLGAGCCTVHGQAGKPAGSQAGDISKDTPRKPAGVRTPVPDPHHRLPGASRWLSARGT